MLGPTDPDVKFVPPAPELVVPLVDDLLVFCNRTDIPAIPQAAIAHARFEEIHPFPDGNGRTGRALVHAMFVKRGLVRERFVLPISSMLSKTAQAYEDALYDFQWCDGHLADDPAATDSIINVFIEAVDHSLALANSISEQVEAIQARWRASMRIQSRSLLDRFLANLPTHPVLDAQFIQDRYHVSRRQANRLLNDLASADVLQSRNMGPGGRRGYEATALIDAFRASQPEPNTSTVVSPDRKPPLTVDDFTPAGLDEDRSLTQAAPTTRAETRQLCGAWMPRAKTNCGLYRGHNGPHRRTQNW